MNTPVFNSVCKMVRGLQMDRMRRNQSPLETYYLGQRLTSELLYEAQFFATYPCQSTETRLFGVRILPYPAIH